MDTPVVPIEKTMEQAPVLATIPAAAVVKAKAASGAVKVELRLGWQRSGKM